MTFKRSYFILHWGNEAFLKVSLYKGEYRSDSMCFLMHVCVGGGVGGAVRFTLKELRVCCRGCGVKAASVCEVRAPRQHLNFPLIMGGRRYQSQTKGLWRRVGGDLQSAAGLRRWCDSFLFTPEQPFFFSSPLSSCLRRYGELKNNWGSGLSLNPLISALPPPCVSLSIRPVSLCHVHLCFSFFSPLELHITGSVIPELFSFRLRNIFPNWNQESTCVSVLVEVHSDLSRIVSHCLCWAITAEYKHLPQDVAQLRAAVSFQLQQNTNSLFSALTGWCTFRLKEEVLCSG